MHGFLGLYRALLSLISRKQVDAWFIHCFLEASSVLQTPSHMSQNPPPKLAASLPNTSPTSTDRHYRLRAGGTQRKQASFHFL